MYHCQAFLRKHVLFFIVKGVSNNVMLTKKIHTEFINIFFITMYTLTKSNGITNAY